MTRMFTYELENGDDVNVVYEFVDEDQTVGLNAEFEISVYRNGVEITNVLTEKDRKKIQTEVAYCWREFVEQEKLEADYARYENRDHGI